MTDFQLDAKELTKDLPFLIKGPVKSLIDYINNLDLNHDGKKDMAQYAPFVIKLLPILIEFANNINWQEVLIWFKSHYFAKDPAKLDAHVAAIKQTHAEITAITPKN